MSTFHATLNACNHADMPRIRSPLEAFDLLRRVAPAFAARLGNSLRHRWTMRRLDHFSDRRLHDLGFERDWDGTVIPIVADR